MAGFTQHYQQGYLVKNLMLLLQADWMVEAETLKLVKESLPILMDFYKSKGADDLKNLPIRKAIDEPLKETYTVPLFSAPFCTMLLDEIQNMEQHFAFEPNAEEDELRQIPEIVLQERVPDLYIALMRIVYSVMNPIFLALWMRHATGGGIQIANYNLKDKTQGAWHHDIDSSISVVVPLNTEDYGGGGTEFYSRGVLEPLPTGTALMFPGFTHMHRGLSVKSGNRYLLVFWLTFDEDEEMI